MVQDGDENTALVQQGLYNSDGVGVLITGSVVLVGDAKRMLA